MRQLVEKSEEQQIPLHLHFNDFEAEFKTVWREAVSYMMSCGIHSRIISRLEQLYRNVEGAVAVTGVMTDRFRIKIGVRQGCVISFTLFNSFLD